MKVFRTYTKNSKFAPGLSVKLKMADFFTKIVNLGHFLSFYSTLFNSIGYIYICDNQVHSMLFIYQHNVLLTAPKLPKTAEIF